MNKKCYVIEYSKQLFEEVGDDIWSWIEINPKIEYFDNECDYNSRKTELENDSDIKIKGLYWGDLFKMQ